MGKKKRGHPDIEEVLSRPWCYYCERDFDDVRILLDHQRAKHFKCDRCGRRLNTAGGLSVHMTQVHKESLGLIENALPNRQNPDVEIFGTEGIPDDIAEQHRQRVLQQFAQEEADRREASGNVVGGDGRVKKPKVESISEMKKRLAEHKARQAELVAKGAGGDDDGTPEQSAAAPAAPSMPGQTQSQPFQFSAPGAPGFLTAQSQQQGFVPGQLPPHQAFASGPGMPTFSPPPQQMFSPPQGFDPASLPPGAAPPGMSFPGSPFAAQQQAQFAPPGMPAMPGQFAMGTPAGMGAPPGAPGLPQRPAFGNGYTGMGVPPGLPQVPPGMPFGTAPFAGNHGNASQVTAPQQLNVQQPESSAASKITEASSRTEEAKATTTKKKDKSENTRMVYADNDTSPEEKMAMMSKYRFERDRSEKMGTGPAPAEGTIVEQDETEGAVVNTVAEDEPRNFG